MLIIYKPYHKDDAFECWSHECVKVIKLPFGLGEILFSKQIPEEDWDQRACETVPATFDILTDTSLAAEDRVLKAQDRLLSSAAYKR